jgi:hypothetical protein
LSLGCTCQRLTQQIRGSFPVLRPHMSEQSRERRQRLEQAEMVSQQFQRAEPGGFPFGLLGKLPQPVHHPARGKLDPLGYAFPQRLAQHAQLLHNIPAA